MFHLVCAVGTATLSAVWYSSLGLDTLLIVNAKEIAKGRKIVRSNRILTLEAEEAKRMQILF